MRPPVPVRPLALAAALACAGPAAGFVNIEFSSVDHGFFCDARSNYDASAAAQVWPLTLAFLHSHLG